MKRIDVRTGNSRSLLNRSVDDTNYALGAIGPYVVDHVGGFLIEKRRAVRQRGGWVSARMSDGSYDRPTGDRRDDR